MILKVRKCQLQPTSWNGSDPGERFGSECTESVVVEQNQRQGRHHQQRQQRGWQPLTNACGGEKDDGQSHAANGDCRQVRGAPIQQHLQTGNHSSLGSDAGERTDLKDQNNHSNSRHEAGDHGVRHEGDVSPEPKDAEHCLDHATSDDGSHHQRKHFTCRQIS